MKMQSLNFVEDQRSDRANNVKRKGLFLDKSSGKPL